MALAIAALIVTASVVGAVVYYELRLKGHGRIKVVGGTVYFDPEGTKEVAAIDWGMISPGGSAYTTLYFKSESNVPTNMTFRTEFWDPPEAGDFISMTWDYDGRDLNPDEILEVTLTLSVADAITGISEFSFDIVIVFAG